jgi:hypothetical protein
MHLAHREWSKRNEEAEVVPLIFRTRMRSCANNLEIDLEEKFEMKGIFVFAILQFLKFRFLQILIVAFRLDGLPLPRGRDGRGIHKKVCVISEERRAARRRRPAHTCLLCPELHAVDVPSF